MSRKSAKSGKSAMWAKPALVLKTRTARALALAIVFVMGAMFIVVAGREPSPPDVAAVDVPLAKPEPTVGTARTTAPANRAPSARPATSAPAPKPSVVTTVTDTRVASTAAAPAQDPEVITITGCLEQDDDKFRLEDTEGEDAPQSRGWTTGFLKRKNRSVDVIDARNRFKLADHVGERVRATGALVDGDIQLRSLRRIASSCEQEA